MTARLIVDGNDLVLVASDQVPVRTLHAYCFAADGIAGDIEHGAIVELLERHVGNGAHPARVGHLGATAALALSLGDEAQCGSADDQRRALKRFLQDVQLDQGGYGSFWTSTFEPVQEQLRMSRPATAVHWWVMSGQPGWRPMGWDEPRVKAVRESRRTAWTQSAGELKIRFVCSSGDVAEPDDADVVGDIAWSAFITRMNRLLQAPRSDGKASSSASVAFRIRYRSATDENLPEIVALGGAKKGGTPTQRRLTVDRALLKGSTETRLAVLVDARDKADVLEVQTLDT